MRFSSFDWRRRSTAPGGRWILECQPELVSLLEGTAGVERIIRAGEPLPAFDLQIPSAGITQSLGDQAG